MQSAHKLDPSTPQAPSELKESILRSQPSNPALQRLQSRVLARVDASEVITSYDRMHHRHNRS